MKSRSQFSVVVALAAVIMSCAIGSLRAVAQTSRVIPFSNVVTTLPPSTPAQPVSVQLWDSAAGGVMLFSEARNVDTDAGSAINFNFGDQTPNGLDPANFPSGSSRFLDVVDPATGATVLAARIPLNATPFALSPGPAGPPGPTGPAGPAGPPGPVNSVAAGDTSITVGGTASVPTIAVAPNGIRNANLADGALSPTKIAGTAATLGANTFGDAQTILGGVTVRGLNPDGAMLTARRISDDAYISVDVGLISGTNNKATGVAYRRNFANRWLVGADNASEVGSNSGSDFRINRYTDSGVLVDTSLFIKRTSGNVGIGTTAPIAKLHAQNGASAAGLGGGNAIVGECNMGGCAGVVGSVANGQAGVLGIANGANSIAMQGIASGGGYAMYANGNTGQALGSSGWVKALVFYDGLSIGPPMTRCYNSTLTGSAASTPPCGITVTRFTNGGVSVDFGFNVSARFVSVSPQYGDQFFEAIRNMGANFSFLTANPNTVNVFTFHTTDTGTTVDSGFMLVVY